jgi:hypothetical protein
MRRLTLFSAIAVALNTVGLVLWVSGVPAQATPTSSTSLYNCSLRQVRPTNIVITCADSNRYLKDVKWSSWTTTDAEAIGTLHWNGCTPACYDGTWHSTRIHFSARDPKTILKHRVFTELYGPSSAWGTGSRVWKLPTKPE